MFKALGIFVTFPSFIFLTILRFPISFYLLQKSTPTQTSGGRIGWIGGRVGWIGGRVGWIGGRVGWIGGCVGWIGGRVGWTGGRVGWIGGRVGWIGGRVGWIEGRVGLIGGRVGWIEGRVGWIEGRVGSARFYLDQHVGNGNTKSSHWGYRPTRDPNAKGFALQWNIGFIVFIL